MSRDLQNSALAGDNAALIEELYEQYLANPQNVGPKWRDYFSKMDETSAGKAKAVEPQLQIMDQSYSDAFYELSIDSLLDLYRKHGHRAAQLDPLGLRKQDREIIDQKIGKLSKKDLQREISFGAMGKLPLSELLQYFERTYCHTIGFEHHYLVNNEERNWLQSRIEDRNYFGSLNASAQRRIFEKLFHADYLEKFFAKKYVGKKRFSLEGSDSLIPLLDTLIEEAGANQVGGIYLGMAHRGRLNVLANILQKPIGQLFAEFEERFDESKGFNSDVKYHLGYSNMIPTSSGREIKVSLAYNPSHLEAVNPVVMGIVRAKQARESGNRDSHIPVLLHGDASFMGQGVVAESLNLMSLEGYHVGGTIHIVENNQIGFTTNPEEARSTLYATDLAKGFQIPVFHVNGDDPEAVYNVIKLAFAYRMRYHKDVMVDLITYRRHGHNEMDEPSFTQPVMYDRVRKHPVPYKVYEDFLLKNKYLQEEDLEFVKEGTRSSLGQSFDKSQERGIAMGVEKRTGVWERFSTEWQEQSVDTSISHSVWQRLGEDITSIPDKIQASSKLTRLMDHRSDMLSGKSLVNWGMAETMAFGSLLLEGFSVRLSGQDAQRGTFSQRHLVVVDTQNDQKFFPLNHLDKNQAHLEAVNSSLSEFSVMGFEYGYSLSAPNALIMWEGQFGDFANGAQIVIDQFLSSGKVKWNRLSGLVLLLPHGQEGQGPEHSSARLERFLQLAAQKNIQVVNCSTPAQYFHVLRRQMHQSFRKPLVIMTPKSLLRHPEAGSFVEDFVSGRFSPVLDDVEVDDPSMIERVVLCSGKIYYDLLAQRRKQEGQGKRTAIIRLEQLYPFPDKELAGIGRQYSQAKSWLWLQEEPSNQGAYMFVEKWIQPVLQQLGLKRLEYIGREECASPATGLMKIYTRQQEELVKQALAEGE